MIERLNRTYKTSYRPTNGFDNIDGANYELALWVTYYNFLRPHKHNNYKVLNDIEMLHGANNIPGKWQLLIVLVKLFGNTLFGNHALYRNSIGVI